MSSAHASDAITIFQMMILSSRLRDSDDLGWCRSKGGMGSIDLAARPLVLTPGQIIRSNRELVSPIFALRTQTRLDARRSFYSTLPERKFQRNAIIEKTRGYLLCRRSSTLPDTECIPMYDDVKEISVNPRPHHHRAMRLSTKTYIRQERQTLYKCQQYTTHLVGYYWLSLGSLNWSFIHTVRVQTQIKDL